MGNNKKYICRICFTKIKDDSYKAVEDIHKEMLEVVVKKLDWELSVDPIICQDCLTKLDDSFSFKSNCIYVEDFLTPYIVEQKLTRSKQDKKIPKKEFKLDIPLNAGQQLCRLCIATIDNNEVRLSETDKERFRKCLPEINACSNLIDAVCSACYELLQHFLKFSEMCMENENKLDAYCKTIRRRGNRQVVLSAFLEFAGATDTSERAIPDGEFKARPMPNGKFGCPVCAFSTKYLPYLRVHKALHDNVAVKLYKCPECPLETKYEDCLKKHMKIVHSEDAELYECATCSFKTKHKISLRRHISNHPEATPFECNECPFKTKYSSSLDKHVCRHKKEKVYFKCDLCSYETVRKDLQIKHIAKHKEPPVERFKCSFCDFNTPKKSGITKHEKVHRRDGRKLSLHRCPHCVYETFGALSLAIHLNKVHDYKKKPTLKEKYLCERDIRKFECPKCDFASVTRPGLTTHVKKKHPSLKIKREIEKYQCDLCDYQASTKFYLLNVHKLKHEDVPEEAMLKCDKCSYKSKYAAGLANHLRVRHSNVTYKCPMCTFETKHRRSINQHVNIRHGMRAKTHKCKYCPFTSKWPVSLANHQVVHEEAVLSCNVCDFRTRYPRSLRNHLRDKHKSTVKSEENDRGYQCSRCSFKADTRKNLTRHVFAVHKELVQYKVRYDCYRCSFSTKSRDAMIRHTTIHREFAESDWFKCGLCQFKSKYDRSLRNHMSNLHPTESESSQIKLMRSEVKRHKLSMAKG